MIKIMVAVSIFVGKTPHSSNTDWNVYTYAEKYIRMLGLVYLCNGSQSSHYSETEWCIYSIYTSYAFSQLHSPSLFHKSRPRYAEENIKIQVFKFILGWCDRSTVARCQVPTEAALAPPTSAGQAGKYS